MERGIEPFKFGLGQIVKIGVSDSQEYGKVVGTAFYGHMENCYLLRYKAGDGRAVEQWWTESALEAA